MSKLRSIAASLSLVVGTFVAAACAAGTDPVQPLAPGEAALQSASHAHMGAEKGTTGGWMDGKTVTFFYNKPFFCKAPPSSTATSGCEVGAEPQVAPRGGRIPVLYVMTPLGFRPDESTLQCPKVGSCINHPSTLDLTRLAAVLGPGLENVDLPAHSHVIGREDAELAERAAKAGDANAGWWEIEVVGVTDPAVWEQIAREKSLEAVRVAQAASRANGDLRITGDIPSNLYLFFGVRR